MYKFTSLISYLLLNITKLLCYRRSLEYFDKLNISLMKMMLRQVAGFARYKYPYNINVEENAGYLKKVKRAEELITQSQIATPIPRRKRRIYDRPRIDRDISNYGAWRIFNLQEWLHKPNEHCMEVVAKVKLQPKWLVHALGIGCLPIANTRSSNLEFMFEDNQLGRYLLYEYRNTTEFRPNREDYDYDNQDQIHPRQRIKARLDPEDFWKSEEEFEFRINSTIHSEHHKFVEWLKAEVEKKKQEKSYDEYIDEKYGKSFSFNHKSQKDFFQPNKPAVTNITPAHFAEKTKKGKEPEPSKFRVHRKLQEKYRLVEAEIKQIEENKS